MQEETELKLSLPFDQADRLKRHPIIRDLKSGRARTRRMMGTYFDTEDLFLKKRDLSLRVRESDNRHIQTLKRAGPASGGLFVRDEWEHEVPGATPNVLLIEDDGVRNSLAKLNGTAALRPIFETDIKRTAWDLTDGETTIELVLDIGEVRSPDGASEMICEAELELKSGDPKRIFDIALALNERIDCTVGHVSKSDRGYALCNSAPLVATKAKPVILSRRMTVWEGFVEICNGCLAQLRANESIARDAQDPEGIHQTRVAIRRLRAAFKIFRKVLPAADRRYFAQELRWLQQELGKARDLDVFILETVEPLRSRLPDDNSLADLAKRAQAGRRTASRRAQKVLKSRRYGRFLLMLERWCLFPDHDIAVTGSGRSIGRFAKHSVRKSEKKLLAFGRHLGLVNDAQLHAVRIQGKQTRYCVEFFASLYPKPTVRKHIKALSALQDCLGGLNDGVVADKLLARFGRGRNPIDDSARAYVVGWYAARIHGERRQLRKIWPRLVKQDQYWN
jgi:inorganic triphosphatase YgiF